MSENGKSAEWVKWIVGIVLAAAMSIGGYSINQSIANESRITALEIEFKQVRTEVTNLWTKYNAAVDNRQEFITRLITLELKLEQIEKDLENLK